ncbi:MAG TPA: biotin/lipoyl-containing protein [Ktedonosporobacter sp.]|nr:biotin/lipoyl-containing protein [Ktedonosporobacter sp.]
MSYITTIHNQTYTIDTGENGQRRSIIIEGMEHAIDWRQIAALTADAKGQASAGGRYSVIIAGKSYDVLARRIPKPNEKDSQTYEVQIAGERFEVKVEDERTRKLAGLARAGSHTGEATIDAPMPGLVVNVPVEAGTTVSEGETVVVLEAMKMENDLQSPISGKVKEVRVSKGQAVEQGQVLVVIEGAP